MSVKKPSWNYADFRSRFMAGMIDFAFLATTCVFLIYVSNLVVDHIAKGEYDASRQLTNEDINDRYNTKFAAPAAKIFGYTPNNAVLQKEFLGMESERTADDATLKSKWKERLTSTDTIKETLPNSDIVLLFPPSTLTRTRSEEKEKFIATYNHFVNGGNALDRFRIAFPEFKHIPDNLVIETLHEHFFYKLDDETMRKEIGFWGHTTENDCYSMAIAFVLLAYVIGYFTLMQSSSMACTMGKRVFGIKVTNDNRSNDHRMTHTESLIYTLCFLGTSIGSLFTIYLPILRNKKIHQTFYDKKCNVQLIRKS